MQTFEQLWAYFREEAILSLVEQGYFSQKSFLPADLLDFLAGRSQLLAEKNLFKEAAIGKGTLKTKDESIRSDEIRWIDEKDLSFDAVQSFLSPLVKLVRQELFLPVKRFESHFAHYPVGSFYKRHRDRHKNSPSRLLTCVVYLSDMDEADGGELVLYPDNGASVKIQPKAGKLVLFKSELEHEVLLARKDRWSLCSWLRDDIDNVISI
ncbi:MAG: 2OG-Fe(II) oxygenase [Bdellovibrionota bacterium]|nr:2OG-Fe(II) oxygenase [Pseudobdellovibrionaceae bacterium]|tara:strand:- start:85611 stop:86237 length:627 start_codon:yes stop_codon:yes gene_type:complete